MERGEFRGTIGRYHWESEPWWPPAARPPEGAPNVIVVVLDDVGFAQVGCFGSDLDTPVLDGLAAGGLRYTNFHTTALCSPTRATLLTGRNHHSVGMGRIIDLATGFPGYDARMPRSAGTLPEILTPQGYSAWAVGKWHLTPEEELHLGASRRRWPLGRGFERFYGFFPGETHQFAPALVHDNHFVDPPGTYDDGYHLTEDLADHAIEYVNDLRAVDSEKPFFLWFATGACHSPHHAPRRWIEHYAGRFDEGWDAWREATFERQKAMGIVPEHTTLSERPDWVPAWDSLSEDTRRVYARFMEAFAAQLSHTDEQLGRIFAHLRDTDDWENTLVVVVSDNGASSEGGPVGSVNDARAWNALPRTVDEALEHLDEIGGPRWHNNYPWGWTVAGNTPFRRWKREVHEGGVADPCIVHWPARIADAGATRAQYVHSIDVAPTVLDAIGVEAPSEIDGVEQQPIEGVSFTHTFDSAAAPSGRTTQYYEMFGCRALYHEGWKAVTYHQIQFDEPGIDRTDLWELYDLTADPAETDDLAGECPDKLAELIERWWVEASRYQVLPLDNRPFSEFVLERPHYRPHRNRYVYRVPSGRISEEAAVNTKSRPHEIAAEVEIPDGGAEGVLVNQGSVLGGWSFHLKDGTLSYVHNLASFERPRVDARVDLAPGAHTLGFRMSAHDDGDGWLGELLVDGAVVASAPFARLTWSRYSLCGDGLRVGRSASLLPPCDDYEGLFPFTGTLRQVVVDVEGEPVIDADAEADVAVRTQ